MRTRINNITFTPGTRSIITGITDLTIDDIRLFINESQMKVICSSMQKDNIDSISSGVVTYKDTFPVLAVGDHITFEIDKGDNVAKEVNATANKNEILTKIENTKPDLSTVAKQGSNPNTSLTSVDEKIDGFYDTFDADIASQLQEIIGDSTTGLTGTTQTEEQVSTLRTLQESYDRLAGNMQSLADSWTAEVTNRKSLSGIVCSREVNCVADILANPSIVLEINDIRATTLQQSNAFSQYTNLRKLELGLVNVSANNNFIGIHADCEIRLPYATTIDGSALTSYGNGTNNYRILYAPNIQSVGINVAYNNSYAQEVYLDSVISIPDYVFRTSANLRILYIPKVSSISMAENLLGLSSLIDLTIGENMHNNFSLVNWSPTYALNSSSQSLLTPEDIAAGFTSNLQKLLYNIREHIAANLPDRTGLSSLTITFSSAVKSAIQADQATADAFANKNWVIA